MNTSYLTVDEYKRAPTAVNPMEIDPTPAASGQQSYQDAELANVIARASSFIDEYTGLEGLYASLTSEVRTVNITKHGYLRIRPYSIPVLTVQSFQWKIYPTAEWTSIDLSLIQVFPRYFEALMWFPFYNGPALQINQLYAYPISAPYTPYVDPLEIAKLADMEVIVQYSYVKGYPNTTLEATSAAGSSTLDLEDTTGMSSGTSLTIYDGDKTERVTLSADPVGNTVNLSKPLKFDHLTVGVGVSSIPPSVKEATILIVNYLLKEKGVNSITMQGAANPLMQKYDDIRDIQIARDLIHSYRRVV